MINILFVHQASELYGSDKTLFDLTTGLNKSQFHPVVILPGPGPLQDELHAKNIETHIVTLTKLSRVKMSISGLAQIPFSLLKSTHALTKVLSGTRIDIVHSNTLAVLTGAAWAKLHSKPHVWHVHEMITKPTFVKKGYAILLNVLADKVVFISNASKDLFTSSNPKLTKKSTVVWNGLNRTIPKNADKISSLRRNLGLNKHDILVALVGRINRWKGQQLLIQAATAIWEKQIENIHFLIVGSAPPGQNHFKKSLVEAANNSPASEQIHFMDFYRNIWEIWDACDIAVLPSTEPEPFGMVVLEAMASQKPVVAAGHGGVTEIVKNNETGYIITPSNTQELADALIKLSLDQELRNKFAKSGFLRYKNHFLLKNYLSSFESIYKNITQL